MGKVGVLPHVEDSAGAGCVGRGDHLRGTAPVVLTAPVVRAADACLAAYFTSCPLVEVIVVDVAGAVSPPVREESIPASQVATRVRR